MKRMRIYYALTTYHILCCTLHCMTHPAEQKTVLLLSDIHKNSVAFLPKYRAAGIFDEIYLLPEAEVTDRARSMERHGVPVSVTLKHCCNMIRRRLPVPVTERDELYLCPDHFPFGWLVVTSKLKYHCFEEGCGVLSDREFALINMSRNKTQRRLYDKLRLFGDNDYAIEVFADVRQQQPGYQNDKMTDFSVVDILQALSEDELDKVLAFFGCKREHIPVPAGLILTQHMANLSLMPLEDQHRLYTLFADLFLDGKHLVIKPHPDDIAGCYQEIFSGAATVLPFAMPSELLPFCIDVTFDRAIAAYSTAVRSLGKSTKEAVCFDSRILTDFRYLLRYFAVSLLLRQLCRDGDSIRTNANELLLDELCSHQYRFEALSGQGKLCLVSDCADEGTDISQQLAEAKALMDDLENTIIFLNERELYLYFGGDNEDVFQYVRPLFLDCSGGTSQTIYIYSRQESMLERVNQMNQTKTLKYTGLTVDIHGISRAEQEKLRVLEGVLVATERRLKEYVMRAKEETK